MVNHVDNSKSTRLQGWTCAMVLCWLLGTGCLLPWNGSIIIVDYYINIFPHYHPTRVLTLIYQLVSIGTLAILAYYEARINTRRRNLAGYTIFFFSIVGVLVLDLATYGKGGLGTFIGICVCNGLYGLADAHAQGGMIGDLSYMAPEFMQSFLAGLAASGTLCSGLRMIIKAAFKNSKTGLRDSAIHFLEITAFFELLCVILYGYVLPRLPVIKYYRSKAASEGSMTVVGDLEACGITSDTGLDNAQDRLGKKVLLMENIDYALDLLLIYILTLAIFPGFLSEETSNFSLGSWFPLTLIAIFNASDFIGRYIPVAFLSRNSLLFITIARFALIPAFYYTNKYIYESLMIILTFILGLSNGYLTVCVLTSFPKGYKGPEQNALGNILVLFLLAGILVGVSSGWLWLTVRGS